MMTSNFRATWIGLVLLAFAAWTLTGASGSTDNATAQQSFKTPRLSAQFVALLDEDEDDDRDDDFDDHEDDDHDDDDHGDDDTLDHHEDIEGWIEHLEVDRTHLEVRRAELQATFGELEIVQEIAEIATDADKTAALVVLMVSDDMEFEDLIPFLQEVAQSAKSDAVRRVAKLQLAEAYEEADQPEAAYEMVRALVLGD